MGETETPVLEDTEADLCVEENLERRDGHLLPQTLKIWLGLALRSGARSWVILKALSRCRTVLLTGPLS